MTGLYIGEVSNLFGTSVAIKSHFDLQNTSVLGLYQKVGGSKVPPAIAVIPSLDPTFQNKLVPQFVQNLISKSLSVVGGTAF